MGLVTYEEVNEVFSGKNYGWPIIEGPYSGGAQPSNYEDPVFAYTHDDGCAAVGAAFYSPDLYTFPTEYHGHFFFSDFCQSIIYDLDVNTGIRNDFMGDLSFPVAIEVEASTGAMYVLERGNTSNGGRLIRVQYTGGGVPFISSQPKDDRVGDGEQGVFEAQVLGLDTLHYVWYVDGVEQIGIDTSSFTIDPVNLTMDGAQISFMVYNNLDTTYSDSATLTVVNGSSPTCSINILNPIGLYQGGDVVEYEGVGMDAEDGTLGAESFFWSIDFHHNVHKHQARENGLRNPRAYIALKSPSSWL